MNNFNFNQDGDYGAWLDANKREVLQNAVDAIEPDAMGMDRDQALTLAGAMKNCGFDREDFADVMRRSSYDKGTFAKQWDNFRGSGQNGECTEGTIFEYAQQCGWKWPAPDGTLPQKAEKKKPMLTTEPAEDFRISCIIDTVGYKQKPTPEDAKQIRGREPEPTPTPEPMQIKDFAAAIASGRTFYPAVYNKTTVDGKAKYNLISQQIFVVDIDNEERLTDADGRPVRDENGKERKKCIDEPLTIDTAKDICRANGIFPFFVYETFSSKQHRGEYQKFRLCFALDEPLTVQEVGEVGIKKAVSYFIGLFGKAADGSTKDPARMIYGTDEPDRAKLYACAIKKDKLYKTLFVEPEPEKEDEQETEDLKIEPVGVYIPQFKKNREAYPGNLRTGFLSFDKALGGGFGNELYAIAAETGTGKSAIASAIAQNIAASGTDVLYFALEMGRDEFIARGASCMSAEKDLKNAIPFKEMINDTYNPLTNQFYRRAYSQYEEYVEEYQRRYGEHLYIIESGTTGTTARKIIDIAKKARKSPDDRIVIFVDYLQLLAPDPEDRTQRDKMSTLSAAVAQFKAFASQGQGATVFLISSMANDRAERSVGALSFKYSGDISYTAGVLLGWNWDGVTNVADEEAKNATMDECKRRGFREMTLEVLKHRNGDRAEKTHLKYYPAYNYLIGDEVVNSFSANNTGIMTPESVRKKREEEKARKKLEADRAKRAEAQKQLAEAIEVAKNKSASGFDADIKDVCDYLGKTQRQVENMAKDYGYILRKDGVIVFDGTKTKTSLDVNMPDVFDDGE